MGFFSFVKKAVSKVGGLIGKSVKAVAGGLKKVVSVGGGLMRTLAPVAALIPGFGTVAGLAMGGIGGLLGKIMSKGVAVNEIAGMGMSALRGVAGMDISDAQLLKVQGSAQAALQKARAMGFSDQQASQFLPDSWKFWDKGKDQGVLEKAMAWARKNILVVVGGAVGFFLLRGSRSGRW